MVIRLADGTIANAGALDDGIEYYCGMVKIIPDTELQSRDNIVLTEDVAASVSEATTADTLFRQGSKGQAAVVYLPVAAPKATRATVGPCPMNATQYEHGYGFISFPIAGTSWGNRGMNSAGLCVGASSQILGGLKRLPGSICADIANRVILQTCATVSEVREFCKQHPFTLNLVCSDKNGDVFCAHQTTAGLFEVAGHAPCAMTNHVVDDASMFKLSLFGVCEFRESPTTRLRRGRLMEFAQKNNARINAEDLRKFIADRMSGDPSSTCPKGNIVVTYANPQPEPGTYWIAEPQVTGTEKWTAYNIRDN